MLQFILNDSNIATNALTGTTLLDFVRSEQHLKGTKCGCREGDCGACTVLVGERSGGKMRYRNLTSCLTPIGNVRGKHVVTVEGINVDELKIKNLELKTDAAAATVGQLKTQNPKLKTQNTEGVSETQNPKIDTQNLGLTPVQQAMNDEAATQCGFCTVGFVMSLTGFCLSEETPTTERAIAAIDGNICRCTGYKSIERAAAKIAQFKENATDDTTAFCIENSIVPPYFQGINARLKVLNDAQNVGEVSTQNVGEVRTQNVGEVSNLADVGKVTPNLADGNAILVNNVNVVNVGGGTDLYVQKHDSMVNADSQFLFNAEILRGVKKIGNRCEIGGAATVSDLLNADFLHEAIPNLQRYLKLVSSTPIRNIATLAGNFVNASPIGDMTIFFLALDAVLVLKKGDNRREIALKDFYKGYKIIDKTADEIVEKFYFELPTIEDFFHFEKVCKRTHLDIASVNSAILIRINEDGLIEKANLAMGGVAPIPLFLTKTSAYLLGKHFNHSTARWVNDVLQTEIAPISDVRGSESYKRLLARQLILAHSEELMTF